MQEVILFCAHLKYEIFLSTQNFFIFLRGYLLKEVLLY